MRTSVTTSVTTVPWKSPASRLRVPYAALWRSAYLLGAYLRGAFLLGAALPAIASPVRAGTAEIVLNEILYNPEPATAGGEFVELFNRGSTSVDLSGWGIGNAASFIFPSGTVLPAGGYLVVCRSAADARAFYGINNIAGEFQGDLDNGGDVIELRDAGGAVVDSVAYRDALPWPAEADGGVSLELVDPASDNGLAASWGIGQPYTPGARNSPAAAGSGSVVITEIMYRPQRSEPRDKVDAVNQGPYIEVDDDLLGEYVEVFNRGGIPLDLAGWKFTEGIDFEFPADASLAAGAYLVVAGDPAALKTRFGVRRVYGPFTGKLADGGERITLRDARGKVMDTVRYRDGHPWPVASDELGASLERIDVWSDGSSAANWRASTGKFQSIRTPLQGSDRGWQLVRKRANATSNRFFMFLNAPGEWLIDDFAVRAEEADPNLLSNGSFETDTAGWLLDGNHSGSHRTVEDAHDGTASLRIVAAGPGDSESNHLEILRIRGVFPGRDYTLSFWARSLSGSDSLTFRLSGGGLETTVTALKDFDLARGWSEEDNPAGPFSLRDGDGNLLQARVDHWHPGDLGPDQPAWAKTGDSGAPGWALGNGSAAKGPHPEHDLPAGAVVSLGPAEAWWTAPADGVVTIDGGLWLVRPAGLGQAWRVRKDGQTITEGEILPGAGNSSTKPLAFDSGSGGVEALTRTVVRGSLIQFNAAPLPGGQDDFVAWRIRILFSSGAPAEPDPLPPPLGGVIGFGTPGDANSAASANVPPLVDALSHFPEKPTSRDQVAVTALVTDDDPLASVELETFLGVSAAGSRTPMFDDGAHGDGAALDGVYGAILKAQPTQTFVHYRVHAADTRGGITSFPYDSDPSPTQAYYHYDGELNTKLTFFHIYLTPQNLSRLTADPYSEDYVDSSIAIDGVAYPHTGIRYRGRRSRVHPKHPWKIRFNKGEFYKGNRILDTMIINPFEQWIAFKVFDGAGIPNLESDLIRVHLNGQFWGVYVAFESLNSTWLDKHGLDSAGEAYKARTVETSNQSKNSDLFHNQIVTDYDYWGSWNKKMRPLEQPIHIRELTNALNDMPDAELLPWLDARVDLAQWFKRWSLYILMNIDDFCGHNYYLFLPGGAGGKWQEYAYDFDSGLTFSRVGPLRALYGDGSGGDNPAWQRNKFYQRVSANPTLKRIYLLTLRQALEENYKLDEIFPMVEELFALSAPDRALDIAKWQTSRGSTAELKNVAASQAKTIGTFLTGQGLPAKTEVVAFEPAGGAHQGPLQVKLTPPAGSTAVYTLDGSDPRLSSTRQVFEGPLTLEAGEVLVTAAALKGPFDVSKGNWTLSAAERYQVTGGPPPGVGPFLRGDVNGDGQASGETTDVVFLLAYSFLGGTEPPCLAASDVDANGLLEGVTDAVYLLNYNFLGGSAPPAPFPLCKKSAAPGDVSLGCKAATEGCP